MPCFTRYFYCSPILRSHPESTPIINNRWQQTKSGDPWRRDEDRTIQAGQSYHLRLGNTWQTTIWWWGERLHTPPPKPVKYVVRRKTERKRKKVRKKAQISRPKSLQLNTSNMEEKLFYYSVLIQYVLKALAWMHAINNSRIKGYLPWYWLCGTTRCYFRFRKLPTCTLSDYNPGGTLNKHINNIDNSWDYYSWY